MCDVKVSFSCFGTDAQDSMVCNSHGSCIENNMCVCNSMYYGNQCEILKPSEQVESSFNALEEVNGAVEQFNSYFAVIAFPQDFQEQMKSLGIIDDGSTFSLKSSAEYLPSNPSVVSAIISVDFIKSGNEKVGVSNLKTPIEITFSGLMKNSEQEFVCKYLDINDNTWKTSGVSLLVDTTNTDGTYDLTCLTTHLTSFAVFQQFPVIVDPMTSLQTAFSSSLEAANTQTIIIVAIAVPFGVVVVFMFLLCMIVFMVKTCCMSKPQPPKINYQQELDTIRNSTNFPSQTSAYYTQLGGNGASTGSNYTDTNDIYSRYLELAKIGEGGFGSVFKGIDTKNHNRAKAIKTIRFTSPEELNTNLKEAAQLLNIDHPYVLKVNDFFIDHSILCIDMDYYAMGDLSMFIKSNSYCSEEIIRQVIFQICSALNFIQTKLNLIHRDVKPSNIFIKELNGEMIEVVLADFGLARMSQGSVNRSYSGTPFYMAPEVALGSAYTFNVDVFSLGVTVFEMMTKNKEKTINYLYMTHDASEVRNILRQQMQLPGIYSNELIELVLLMLEKDPAQRLFSGEILLLPYFISIVC